MPAAKTADRPPVTTERLSALKGVLKVDAVARESGIPIGTLRSKIQRGTPLTADEAGKIAAAFDTLGLTV
jgi:hypothetical protein